MKTTAAITQIDTSTNFVRACLRAGTYGLACVGSDGSPRFSNNKGHVFVGFFISEALSGILDEVERTILLVRILSEEYEGAWGFSPPAPFVSDAHQVFLVDSDDTAYVLRTTRRLGVHRSPRCLLPFHREPERLFVTFNAPGRTSLSAEPASQHNLLAHPEVNLNVFLALRGTPFEHLINYGTVRDAQDRLGFWKSYFYPSPFLATALALDLIGTNPEFSDLVSRAVKFILGTQNRDGSWGSDSDPYETALAITALSTVSPESEAIRRGVDHLLASAAGDGSWNSNRCVWEFHAEAEDVWRAHDTDHAFVTAVCAIALRRAVGQLRPL
ncbi:MAG: hypothetical protein ABI634_11775 [Acidobacteriota bacterium]